MTNMPKIIIIETGELPEDLESKHGDYPSMFGEMLAAQGLDLEINRLVRGDDLPELDAADGFLITGSRHGVYDDIEWIPALKDFILACADSKKPLVGICFGHQIMAEALGGKVVKSDKGWGLGPQSYAITDDRFASPNGLTLQAIHQDQVIEKPEGANVICTSEFCEYAGLVYGGQAPYAMSLQAHPEFNTAFVSDLVGGRRGTVYPEPVADAALAKMGTDLDSGLAAKWFADFYKAALV